jgi:putative transposase
LINGVGTRLRKIVLDVANESNSEVFEPGVMPDHVHLLPEADPQSGIHRLAKRLKGLSSRPPRKGFPWLGSRPPALRADSYSASTAGGAPLQTIKRCAQRQKQV